MRLAFRQTHLYRFVNLVGVTRLELVASWSRTKHATKLRYTPTHSAKIIIADFYGFVKSSRKKIRKSV